MSLAIHTNEVILVIGTVCEPKSLQAKTDHRELTMCLKPYLDWERQKRPEVLSADFKCKKSITDVMEMSGRAGRIEVSCFQTPNCSS